MHALAPSVINDDCELHDMMVVYIRRHVMTDDRRLEALPKTKESRALQYISLPDGMDIFALIHTHTPHSRAGAPELE